MAYRIVSLYMLTTIKDNHKKLMMARTKVKAVLGFEAYGFLILAFLNYLWVLNYTMYI